MTQPARSADSLTPDGTFNMLYRIAAFAALATVAVTILQIVIGVICPPPDFAPGCVLELL